MNHLLENNRQKSSLLLCFPVTINQGKDKPIKGLDVTEWFIDAYIARGRCLIDVDHSNWLQYPETRYSEILNPMTHRIYDDRKCCNWCGKILFKIEKEIVTVKTYETWVAI